MKIMTSILKIFLPNSSKMANLAAEKIADSVNKSELKDSIARYASMSKQATEMADWLAKVLQDGTIDEMEVLGLWGCTSSSKFVDGTAVSVGAYVPWEQNLYGVELI